VKSVTLSRQAGLAEFPDSVTKRGAKHLRELSAMVEQGHRAVMLYLVQRDDCTRFALAADIDTEYAVEMAAARETGVETLCFATKPTPLGVNLVEELPIYK
jgi:sugar fermentation stimulation protein A